MKYHLCSFLALILFTTSLSAAEEKQPPLVEKTFVVWAAPANLEQRGGSVLTLDDHQGNFDGIIFGELAPKRWMAGSNFYHRTERNQGSWPEESAAADTFVQLAIVYQGDKISLYRDGELYAQYGGKKLFSFPPHSAVLIGKRHIEQGDSARFAGKIDDARIYHSALSAEQLAALKPNEASEPKPWAWWTFDDEEASEKTGRYPHVKLAGDAKVAAGQLHLGGKGWLTATLDPASSGPVLPPLAPGAVDIARNLREHLLADPHRPGYHFAIPGGRAMPFDPNGAIYWKGRYHLFYIFQDGRGHNWGHVSSRDLFHWRFHPVGLTGGMFSGNCFINKDGKPTMCYHQVGQGNAMAVALDDDLNQWEKLDTNPITPVTKPGDPHHGKYQSWDPFGFVENDQYYAIFGGKHPGVAKAPALGGEWKYTGDLFAHGVEGVNINEDVSCADMFKLGDKHMLLCISHGLGARYYLGDWKNEQFHPQFHEKMSWVDNSYFAPESLVDDKGRRIMWAWIFDQPGFGTRMKHHWSGTMSLPRVLSLGDDGRLRMDVPEEIKSLRYNPRMLENVTMPQETSPLENISGNSLELALEIDPKNARQCGVKVCLSPGGEEETLIYYDAADKKLKIDTKKSSLSEGPKSIEAGPFALSEGEKLKLRVFIDKSVVEVFANNRQAVMRRIYPTRPDSLGVALYSDGGEAVATKVEAWEIDPANGF